MRNIYISAIGLTSVGEHWETSLRELALQAIMAAQQDLAIYAGTPTPRPEALFVGNMLAGELSRQEHLGALVADYAGLPVERDKVRAALRRRSPHPRPAPRAAPRCARRCWPWVRG